LRREMPKPIGGFQPGKKVPAPQKKKKGLLRKGPILLEEGEFDRRRWGEETKGRPGALRKKE